MKRALFSLIGATLIAISAGCGGSDQPEPVKIKESFMNRSQPTGENGGGAPTGGAPQVKKSRLTKPG